MVKSIKSETINLASGTRVLWEFYKYRKKAPLAFKAFLQFYSFAFLGGLFVYIAENLINVFID